jgi:hypothetical protein
MLDFTRLSTEGLIAFIRDAQLRIGTNPESKEYVAKQMEYINQAHEVLIERGNLNGTNS